MRQQLGSHPYTEFNKNKRLLIGRALFSQMTAKAMTGHREECLAVGMNDYLSKPLQLEKLVQVFHGYERLHPPNDSNNLQLEAFRNWKLSEVRAPTEKLRGVWER